MKNIRNKAVTIISIMLTILSMTTIVYADITLPPAAPLVKSSGTSILWPLLIILVVCVIGILALIALKKKK